MSQEQSVSIDDKVSSVYEVLKGMTRYDVDQVLYKLKHVIDNSSVLGEENWG
jgi:hypothetical protein